MKVAGRALGSNDIMRGQTIVSNNGPAKMVGPHKVLIFAHPFVMLNQFERVSPIGPAVLMLQRGVDLRGQSAHGLVELPFGLPGLLRGGIGATQKSSGVNRMRSSPLAPVWRARRR